MTRTLVIFLQRPPLEPSGRYRRRRYDFGEGDVSAPVALFGTALFAWFCRGQRAPDRLRIVGAAHDSWDALHELASLPPDHPGFATLGLNQAVASARGVNRGQLDRLASLLQEYLPGVRVRCHLPFPGALADCSDEGPIHLQLPVQGSSLDLLHQVQRLRVGGIYHADERAPAGAAVPVLRVETAAGAAVDGRAAVAQFRRTGQLGPAISLLTRRRPRLAEALGALDFATLTSRTDEVPALCRQAVTLLRAAGRERDRTAHAVFFHGLADALEEAFAVAHPARWQLELSRRALAGGDHARAARLCAEALLSAAVADPDPRKNREARRQADRQLRSQAHRPPHLSDDLLATYAHLRAFVCALAEGAPPEAPPVLLALCSPRHMDHFLRQALAHACLAVDALLLDHQPITTPGGEAAP